MKKNMIMLSALFCFIFGCQDTHSKASITSTVTESVTNQYSTEEVVTTDTGDEVDTTIVKESNVNSVTHEVGSWKVSVPQTWEIKQPPFNTIQLFATNSREQLLFSALTEVVTVSQQEYVNSQLELLKKLGLTDSSVKPVVVNGVDYMLIEAPKSNFNNWQWVRFEDKTAYVWSCGGPRGKKVNFESCMTIMTTVRK
jgi:hypothetical protein